MSYLDVVYNEKARPRTGYPNQLTEYLFGRFKMKKGDKLLDVGCGREEFVKGFKKLELIVNGMDIEKDSVNVEKDKFPFSDQSFDFVFSKSLIEHLWKPGNFMKECQRVLKPTGRIIIMTPDWYSQRDIFYDDYTHVHPYTVNGVNDLLKMFAFREVESEKFYQLPVLWKYPWLKTLSRFLQLFGPVKRIHKNKFIRWSRELMILSTGIK